MSAFSVSGILDALRVQPTKSAGAGRAIMIVAGQRGQGVTTVSRGVAEAQASGTRAAYAIDLDLKRNAWLAMYDRQLGSRATSVLGGTRFYAPVDDQKRIVSEAPPSYYFRRVGTKNLFVGEFDNSALAPQWRVWMSDRSGYWDAVRASGATMVVAAPSLDRSKAALRIARHMDGVVLVVGADAGAAPAALTAKADLLRAGANLIGLVYAGVTEPVLMIDRMLRKSA